MLGRSKHWYFVTLQNGINVFGLIVLFYWMVLLSPFARFGIIEFYTVTGSMRARLVERFRVSLHEKKFKVDIYGERVVYENADGNLSSEVIYTSNSREWSMSF